MREITITVFTFDELDQAAQETAIEAVREIVFFPWMDEYEDSLKAFCDTLGIRKPKWEDVSLGDINFYHDRAGYHEAMRNKSIDSFDRNAMPTGFCADQTLFLNFVESWEKTGSPVDAIHAAFTKFFKELSEDINHSNSDEGVREYIEANGIEFHKDGTIWCPQHSGD